MNVIVYGATTNSFWIKYPSGAEEIFIFKDPEWAFLTEAKDPIKEINGMDGRVGIIKPTTEETDEIEKLSTEDISNMHRVILTLNRCGQKEAQINLKPLKVS